MLNAPQLLIADEPTTALDVTIQAQVLDLMKRLHARARHGGAADHAQHGRDRAHVRPGGGDVCRRDRRAGTGGRAVRPAAPSLYRRAAAFDPACRPGARQADVASRRAAGHVAAAAGLPLPRALPGAHAPVARSIPSCSTSFPTTVRAAGWRRTARSRRLPLSAEPAGPLLQVQEAARHFQVAERGRVGRGSAARGRWRLARGAVRRDARASSANRAAANRRWRDSWWGCSSRAQGAS